MPPAGQGEPWGRRPSCLSSDSGLQSSDSVCHCSAGPGPLSGSPRTQTPSPAGWLAASFLGAPSTSKARSLRGRHARGRPGKHQGLCPESGELHAGLTLCGVAQGPDESPDTAGTGLTSTPTPLCMGTRGCPASAGSWLLTKLCGKTCSGSRSAGSCAGALEGRIVAPKNTRPSRH